MSEHIPALPDIDNVNPMSKADSLCLQELRSTLVKYGAERRFGVCLLHEHFPFADDEVLVESCDTDTRTLTTRPVHKSLVDGKVIETTWRLDIERPIGKCISYCELEDGPNGKTHVRKHRATL